MAKAFYYFDISNFPDMDFGQKVVTTHQLPLLDTSDSEAHTRIEKLGFAQYDEFEKYFIEHEDIRDVNARYHGQQLRQLIWIYPFDVYKKKAGKYLFTTGSDSAIYKKAFKRLERKGFSCEPEDIELEKLLNAFKQDKTPHIIKGGWFSELGLLGIQAAGIFGSSVDKSNEWDRYSETGILSAITLEISMGGAYESMMITRERTLVFYKHKKEKEYLEMAENFQKLIDLLLADKTA
jgi:hypothetical protein